MVQKFDYPKTENEFNNIREEMYTTTKNLIASGEQPAFKGLLEIIKSEVVIVSAIHKVKANKGSNTPGSSDKTIKDILEQDYLEVVNCIRESLDNYKPLPVRRKWIDKPGKKEKRPLGIPDIADRVIQEMVRQVIEPILDAQFFAHSYGFRPMRDAGMAMERTTDLIHKTGFHWIIEGDISKFFDEVNHTILIKKLYSMGIKDRRVLMIIKQMLKAGIMDEIKTNPKGTPQGGIISPLLANVYLDKFDKWVTREWENKKTRYPYKHSAKKFDKLRKTTNLKPAFLVRYADDWILITKSKSNAEKWRKRIKSYLGTNLKLRLSEEKTKITNVKNNNITFVGIDLKVVKDKSKKYGYYVKSKPNGDNLKRKVKEIHRDIRKTRNFRDKEQLVHNVNLINSKIRGLINYYQMSTWVNKSLNKYDDMLTYAAYKTLKRNKIGKWIPAKEVNNLIGVHADYSSQIPAFEYKGMKIGFTRLTFSKWKKVLLKTQDEVPFTQKGRELHQKRLGKIPPRERADTLINTEFSRIISLGLNRRLYNFEYLMNRAYAYNRDRGKCRVCGEILATFETRTHHINPKLPITIVNRVNNLASTHERCHNYIHNYQKNEEHFTQKVWKKIKGFREKLK
ncbi:group II intron reverse transcriptase/maturase [Bacillus alkalicellulosilyticus]|uniref:group II intron reverse transcriptase/maturase n=1 Tax=Alkalihalobacterium alkalicellulosilyticum TaxID=1912214 RepID=UPI0009989528|nr:group II intron reverse transcriptase/maturase [Bacillus alkalicellulosilyticus]